MALEMTVFNDAFVGQVRTVEKGGEVFFVAKDICACVGLTHPTRSIQHVDEEDKIKIKTGTNGGVQQVTYVNESGLYQLIFMGKTDKAKEFKRWVTSEVLPAIRKTGKYALPKGVETVEEMSEIQRLVDQFLDKE